MEKEHAFYNAVAVTLRGDQRAIGAAKRGHESWGEAYHALLAPVDPEKAAADVEAALVRIVLATEAPFPPRLREIPHSPHAIYIRGNSGAIAPERAAKNAHAIAIVGTRRATQEGKTLARRFGRAIAAAGCAVISGLAFGIDAAGHEGCLEAGKETGAGPAVAVLAGGLAAIHPHSHEGLARRIIASGGALVSEYPMNEPPLARRFIERNRLVSGLSEGVLVIEAPERSGALSTARFALEQNRDVFVLPGNVAQANYKGSNRLIRQGAALVTGPEDIFETYGMVIKSFRGTDAGDIPLGVFTREESAVLAAIARAERDGGMPSDVDKISATAKLEPRIVNRTLSFLIIKGIVKECAGGFTMNDH